MIQRDRLLWTGPQPCPWLAACFFLLGWVSLPSLALGQADVSDLDRAVAQAVTAVRPAIVRLDGSWAQTADSKSAGLVATGLIIDSEGWVLTAAFGFEPPPATLLATTDQGQRFPATIVSSDAIRGLTLLKLQGARDLRSAPLATLDQQRVGQTVVAVGRGLAGDSVQLASGILSATNRIWGRAIQTDARISPIHYGGPLINLKGEVLGICLPRSTEAEDMAAGMDWYDSGIGFAAPLAGTFARLEALKNGQSLQPGQTGIQWSSKELFGQPLSIAMVAPNSPAAQAGLRANDQIIAINDSPIRWLADAKHQLGPAAAGDNVSITALRDGKQITTNLKLTESVPAMPAAGLGIRAGNPGGNEPGIQVLEIDQNAPVADQLQAGDRLLGIAGKPLNGIQAWRQALAMIANQDSATLQVAGPTGAREFSIPLSRRSAKPADAPRQQAAAPQLMSLEFVLAEEDRKCLAWIPQVDTAIPLLVWVPPAGPVAPSEAYADWPAACQQTGVGLLIVESATTAGWRRTDLPALMTAINTLSQRVELDRSRIGIGGSGRQAELASLAALRFRGNLSGLILSSPTSITTAASIQPAPTTPLLVLLESTAASAEAQSEQFQVPSWTQGEVSIGQRLDWIRWLDRL